MRGSLTREFESESALDIQNRRTFQLQRDDWLFSAQSEPLLSNGTAQLTSIDLTNAAQLLESLVLESSAANLVTNKFKNLSLQSNVSRITDKTLNLIYETLKCTCQASLTVDLPFIDSILVKTQFLVYNPQFLENLPLVKIMTFELMKYHFEYQRYPGIDFVCEEELSKRELDMVETIKELQAALKEFRVKMAASLARIRIEKKAAGESPSQMMENILPVEIRQKEFVACNFAVNLTAEMRKCFRVNTLKTSLKAVWKKLHAMGFTEEDIKTDDQFDDLLVTSNETYQNLKNTDLFTNQLLIIQDKSYFYLVEHLRQIIQDDDHIIDTRTGCGTLSVH